MEYPTFVTGFSGWLTPMFVVYGRSLIETVVIHELGHQYFYGLLASNEFEEAWLDEGLTSYAELQCMEAIVSDGLAPGLRWGGFWTRERLLLSLLRTPVQVDQRSWEFQTPRHFFAASYGKTALSLRTLEGLIGTESFSRAMRSYAERYRFRHPAKSDFVAVVNEVAGKDMTWFFDELVDGTRPFDYGVDGLASVKVPARLRGVFDANGTREEWTEEKIEKLEAAGPSESGTPGTMYRTTVKIRRYGDARIGGDARIEVLVRFKDGTTETRTWDGQGRWTRLEFIKPVEAESAQIDPRGVWLIDENLANNSRGTDGVRRNVVKLMTQLLFSVQFVLHFFGSWS